MIPHLEPMIHELRLICAVIGCKSDGSFLIFRGDTNRVDLPLCPAHKKGVSRGLKYRVQFWQDDVHYEASLGRPKL